MTSALTLRPYQQRAIDATMDAMRRGPTILVAPTGAGKTVMGSELIVRKARPALWVAHRQELIDQAHTRLVKSGITAGVIMAGRAPSPGAAVQVASIQTLARRDKPPADLVVLDECHHATAKSYRSLFEHYAGSAIVGLTATPFRLDGVGLGTVGFTEIVVAASTADLCRDGTLVEPTIFAPASPDLSSVETVAGDFNAGQAASVMRGATIIGRIVDTWARRAAGRRTVAFAVNVEHSLSIRDRFRAAGIKAEHIDGTTGAEERARILADLRAHRIDVLCNCMILTEGWDLPSLEVAIVARPTKSLQLHLQMLGRIMRAADGKAGALVLDHAGNYDRHGLPTRAVAYSLDGAVSSGDHTSKKCPMCGLVLSVFEQECPECGHEFGGGAEEQQDLIPGLAVNEVDGHLEVKHAASAAPITFEDKAQFWKRAWHHAMHRKNPKMALARYKQTFGAWPVHVGDRLIDPRAASAEDYAALRVEWQATGRRIAETKEWGKANPRKVEWFARKFASDKEIAMRREARGAM